MRRGAERVECSVLDKPGVFVAADYIPVFLVSLRKFKRVVLVTYSHRTQDLVYVHHHPLPVDTDLSPPAQRPKLTPLQIRLESTPVSCLSSPLN